MCGHAYRDHNPKVGWRAQKDGKWLCLVAGCCCLGFAQPSVVAETETKTTSLVSALEHYELLIRGGFRLHYVGNDSWAWFGEHS